MATKLFETTDRSAAHQFLAEYIEQHPGSAAECREDPGAGLYWVFDGPENQVRQEEERLTVTITGAADIASFKEWLATREGK